MTNEQEMIDGLSPGIRDLVVAMRKAGFNTQDSGDGSNYENGMGCAVPFHMVACLVEKEKAFDEADRMQAFMETQDVDWPWQVEMSYVPGGPCIIAVAEQDPDLIAYYSDENTRDLQPGDEGYIAPGERFIVKVQASLFTTDTEQQVIIYNESRSIMYQCPAAGAQELVDALDPDMPKGFFWTSLDEEGRLQFKTIEPADWQDW